MKVIAADKIKNIVSELCIKANLFLRSDVLISLEKAYLKEADNRAKRILEAVLKNALIARKEKLAICQDTGFPTVFLEIGQQVCIKGDLRRAINKGVESGYNKGHLRNSIIRDPLKRGASGYSPVIIHSEIVPGDKLKIAVLPKGFGCENKTQLKMFKPTADIKEIKQFVVEAVKTAGPDACPPYIVGVGIGGTADYAALLAKKSLLKKINRGAKNKLEQELLKQINKLNIGPMGLGGKTTCLAVNIKTFPTHIAGLPVCVSISCHALRSAEKII